VVIRAGVILPTFRESPDDAFEAAGQALAAGVDGVFCYDHLWPMGQPERPALAPFPLLAALAAATSPRDGAVGGPYFGTLVARIGLVPNDVLEEKFSALEHIAPGRIIAGLGTGDRLSEAENVAYGIAFPPAEERRRSMVHLAGALKRHGTTVWLAGGARARVEEPQEAGVGLNVWDVPAELVADRVQELQPAEVTWAGPSPASDAALAQTVRAMEEAGATWVIFGWPVDPAALVRAAEGHR
jgi:alkanesulfonate monooxygenase SsuD/methylene tetrahydromethanopterin reductase-like flavin-dependent oxidoreductase (luciferase family)